MHAGEIAFERGAAPEFEPMALIVFFEGDASAVKRPCALGAFLRMQLQPLALHADRRWNDASAVSHRARAGHFIEDIIAAGIGFLRRQWPQRRQRRYKNK